MPKIENGRLCLYGTEHSKCNHLMTLGFKGLISDPQRHGFGSWMHASSACQRTAEVNVANAILIIIQRITISYFILIIDALHCKLKHASCDNNG